MKINIRVEEATDQRKSEELAREAFWNLYMPGCEEHFIIHKMRNHEDFIKELSFVAEMDGEIVAGIYYSRSKVLVEDNEYDTITFGPVFVAPQLHRKGIGRMLISSSIEEAKKMGYRAIIIGGYPYHYESYGFVGGKKYGISMGDGNFYTGLLVLPLYEDALDGISGQIEFSPVFEADQDEVDKFDQTFPPKEKKHQKSQDDFELAVTMLDE